MKPALYTAVLAMCLAACDNDPPPVATALDFGKIPPQHTLVAFGGTLLGHDRGEWGGRLAFRDADGRVSEIFRENVRAILPHDQGVVVFTGLSHLGTNEGFIHLLRPDPERGFTVDGMHMLDGEPQRIRPDAQTGAIRFQVFTGRMDMRRGGGDWIYLCRNLESNGRLSIATGCVGPDEDE